MTPTEMLGFFMSVIVVGDRSGDSPVWEVKLHGISVQFEFNWLIPRDLLGYNSRVVQIDFDED
jgi:hypothetical protein